jgi:hypothetical protein
MTRPGRRVRPGAGQDRGAPVAEQDRRAVREGLFLDGTADGEPGERRGGARGVGRAEARGVQYLDRAFDEAAEGHGTEEVRAECELGAVRVGGRDERSTSAVRAIHFSQELRLHGVGVVVVESLAEPSPYWCRRARPGRRPLAEALETWFGRTS